MSDGAICGAEIILEKPAALPERAVFSCDRKAGHKGMHREEREVGGQWVMIHWGKRH